MNDEEECFCDSSTIAPRAPNLDELWLLLEPRLESFSGVCGQPVECDPTLFVSQFLETTILALLLETGTVLSEVEILELKMAYMTAYNEIQANVRKSGQMRRKISPDDFTYGRSEHFGRG
jgi:hypothetical protein